MPRIDGIDTSHHNTLGDPARLPSLTFAMHKLTEGSRYRDPTAATWLAAYRRPNVGHVGGYHYMRSDSPAASQAAHFLATWRALGMGPDDFAVCDWERDSAGAFATPAMVDEWLRIVDLALGPHRVHVYSASWVPGFTIWRAQHPTRGLFYAAYSLAAGEAVARRYGADVWQWTSTAAVSGIVGACDANHLLNPDFFAPTQPPDPDTEDTMPIIDPAQRVHDTRDYRGPLAAGEVLEVPLVATQVDVCVHVVPQGKAGFVVAYGATKPAKASNIDFGPTLPVAGRCLVRLDGGKLRITSTAPCHVVVDLQAAG